MFKFLATFSLMLGSIFVPLAFDSDNQNGNTVIEEFQYEGECYGMSVSEIYGDLDLTEDEQAMLEVLVELEKEYYSTFDSVMDNEDVEYLTEAAFLADMLERDLTTAELAAIDLTEVLYNALDELEVGIDLNEVYISEVNFLENAFDRELTEEEVSALEVLSGLYEAIDYNELDLIDDSDIFNFDNSDVVSDDYSDEFSVVFIITDYENVLDRDLTETEIMAVTYFYSYFSNVE